MAKDKRAKDEARAEMEAGVVVGPAEPDLG
jgi:hypothetical protein